MITTQTLKSDKYVATFRFFRIIQELQLMSQPEAHLEVWRLMRALVEKYTYE